MRTAPRERGPTQRGERREVAPNPRRVWVASYAKSGTTWLRFLLTGLWQGPPRRSADVDLCVPSIHADGVPERAAHDGRGLFHTHQARDHAITRFGSSAGFIYIARHPLDVLLSNMNFFVLTQLSHLQRRRGHEGAPPTSEETDLLATHYVREFLANGGDAFGLRLGYGTWEHNVDTWLDAHDGEPSVIIRYEDMKRDPTGEARRVCRFLRIERDESELETAVAGASFQRMRALEDEEITARIEGRFFKASYEAGHRAGLRFVNKGEVGRGARLPPAVVDSIAARLAKPMERLGYGIEERRAVIREAPTSTAGIRPLLHPLGELA